MKARLFCRYGKMKGASFEIGREATLGRGDGNTITLSPKAVSSRHAKILYDEGRGGYVLEDLGSLNGTELDGAAVSTPQRLDRLNVITFGGSLDFIFQDLAAYPSASPAVVSDKEGTQAGAAPPDLPSVLAAGQREREPREQERGGTLIEQEGIVLPPHLAAGKSAANDEPETTQLEPLEAGSSPQSSEGTQSDFEVPKLPTHLMSPAAVEPAMPASAQAGQVAVGGERPAQGASAEGFWLELSSRIGPVRRFNLVPGDNVVGRGEGAAVMLEGPDISRRHAILSLHGEVVRLRDEGSSNHTYVNDERLVGEVNLEVGARIRFGSLEARLRTSFPHLKREDPS